MGQSYNRKIRRQQARDTNRVLDKLKTIAVKVNKEQGWTKFYICINSKQQRDIMVLPYNGNEGLEGSLGSDNILVAGSIMRKDQVVLLAEHKDNGTISIRDGIGEYIIKVSNL